MSGPTGRVAPVRVEPVPLGADMLGRLVDIRVHDPAAVRRGWAARVRRPFAGADGKVLIVAADHPARGALGAGANRFAMADRAALLTRLASALANPAVDGVLAAPDLLDDLLLLGLLENRLAIGSMNRGGVAGASFEIDDRFTGTTPSAVAANGLDGAKMLLRVDLADPASAAALERCAAAVSALAQIGAVAMVEPFLSRRRDGRLVNDLSTDAVVAAAVVAAGLGDTSAFTWLKLPVVDGFEAVAAATGLPVVLLGGEVDDDVEGQQRGWGNALALPSVRGLTVGRSLLFPPHGDVAAAVAAALALLGRADSGANMLPDHPRSASPGSASPGSNRSAYVHPAGSLRAGNELVALTPERAGWTYSGLRVFDLTAGAAVNFDTGVAEAVLLPLSARGVQVQIDDRAGVHRFCLQGRPSVFAGTSDFCYAGRGSQVTVTASTGGRLAVTTARCERELSARYQPADAVPVELRGAGSCSRQVHNFAAAGVFDADRLIAVEVLTPGGNWSSYPPHKHDEDVPGIESELEEIYYFEIRAAGQPGIDTGTDDRAAGGQAASALGYQRVYGTPERPIDVLTPVRTGDVVTMPHGWHGPSMASPGYDMYYLNVMAGPSAERAWLIRDDPDYAWVRRSWADQPVDPRLPMTGTRPRDQQSRDRRSRDRRSRDQKV